MAALTDTRENRRIPVVLSIGGFDPSSGAGITADIKTIAAHRCYGATCITALTIQTTTGVRAVEPVKPEIIQRTLRELAADLPIAAIRIGMLGSGEVAGSVADFLEAVRLPNVVLDPIVRSSSGAELLDGAGVAILRERILPLSSVVTPNLDEIRVLTGVPATTEEDAQRGSRMLLAKGVKAVVLTGGHLANPVDRLFWLDRGTMQHQAFPSRKLESTSTHGTGCAFATSLACSLAGGMALPEAVVRAQQYVFRGIESAEPLGHGTGPINHLWPFDQR